MDVLVDKLKANGILLSPGYEYESVERDIFLMKEQIHEKFCAIRAFSGKYKIDATPMFLEFAAGLRERPCSPWSTVNYTPKGWKAPCYLIEGEGYLYPTSRYIISQAKSRVEATALATKYFLNASDPNKLRR